MKTILPVSLETLQSAVKLRAQYNVVLIPLLFANNVVSILPRMLSFVGLSLQFATANTNSPKRHAMKTPAPI